VPEEPHALAPSREPQAYDADFGVAMLLRPAADGSGM
jgi:hypothetical protein